MIDMFTTKRISPDCLCKSNHRQVKILILITLCAIYLWGMLHTPEIISTVGCTPQISSPLYAAYSWDWLRGVFCTAEMISSICCTLLRSSPRCVARWRDNFVIEYLNKIETEFANILQKMLTLRSVSTHFVECSNFKFEYLRENKF